MKNKFLLLLICLLSANMVMVLLNSCSGNYGKTHLQCGYYDRAALFAMDNTDSIPREPAATGVRYKSFVLQLTLWENIYNCSRTRKLFPENTAFAVIPGYSPRISFKDITITSNIDFDATHPAGTDLKAYFSIRSSAPFDYFHPGTNNIYLLQAPENEGWHIFTIHLFSDDNTHDLIADAAQVKILL